MEEAVYAVALQKFKKLNNYIDMEIFEWIIPHIPIKPRVICLTPSIIQRRLKEIENYYSIYCDNPKKYISEWRQCFIILQETIHDIKNLPEDSFIPIAQRYQLIPDLLTLAKKLTISYSKQEFKETQDYIKNIYAQL